LTERRIRRSWRRWWKPVALTLEACFSRLRSDEMTTPSTRTSWLAKTVSAPSRRQGNLPKHTARGSIWCRPRVAQFCPRSASVDWPVLRQDTGGRNRWVLDTLVRARALDSCSYQGVCCVCVWRPSANVPIASVDLQVSPRWGVKGRGEG